MTASQQKGDAVPRRVLLVEDHEPTRYAMRHFLRTAGVEAVEEAATAEAAIALLSATDPPRCVLLDWLIPGGSGGRVIRFVRERELDVRVIVLTVAYEREHAAIEALRPDGIFPKPIDPEEMVAALRACGQRAGGDQD